MAVSYDKDKIRNKAIKTIIKACLKKDIQNRCSIEQLCKHPALEKIIGQIEAQSVDRKLADPPKYSSSEPQDEERDDLDEFEDDNTTSLGSMDQNNKSEFSKEKFIR